MQQPASHSVSKLLHKDVKELDLCLPVITPCGEPHTANEPTAHLIGFQLLLYSLQLNVLPAQASCVLTSILSVNVGQASLGKVADLDEFQDCVHHACMTLADCCWHGNDVD